MMLPRIGALMVFFSENIVESEAVGVVPNNPIGGFRRDKCSDC
jgi:hypothetical protein